MSIIGEGSYSKVHLTDKQTALKVCNTKYYYIFLREISLIRFLGLNEVSKDYTPTLLGFDASKGTIEMVKYVKDLNIWLLNDSPSVSDRAAVIRPLIKSIFYIHNNHIFHCDLKPSNLMLNGDTIIIIDYGLAGTGVNGSQCQYLKYSTPAYKDESTEVGNLADIYCVGVIIAEIMTGDTLLGKKNLKSKLQKIDSSFRSLIRSMTRSKASKRPSIAEVATFFNVEAPSIIKKPPGELFTSEVRECVIDWIDTIISQLHIGGPLSTQNLAVLSHTVSNEPKHLQVFAAAIIYIYSSIYFSQIPIQTIIALCPTGLSYNERKEILFQSIQQVLENDLVVYCLIKNDF